MAEFSERFLAAFDILSDYGGYIDADIVAVTEPDAIGISLESDGFGDYKRLVYRYFRQAPVLPRQRCGVYGFVEVQGDDIRAVLLDSFADSKGGDVGYYYRPQKMTEGSSSEQALCLIESALGKLLISRDK